VRYSLGEQLVHRYLEFVAGRCRPNTLRAVAFDLKAFFTVIGKDPVEVTPADVFDFLARQRGDRTVVRLADRESGLSARTIARRLSSVSGLYAYLVARGDTPVRVNPVPCGLSTRRQGGPDRSRTVPLVRVPRTLPTILSADGVGAALASRWPLGEVAEADLHVTDRTRDFPWADAVVAQVLAPEPFLFVHRKPSWPIPYAYEREQQAARCARFVEERLDGREMHVVLAGDFDAAPDSGNVPGAGTQDRLHHGAVRGPRRRSPARNWPAPGHAREAPRRSPSGSPRTAWPGPRTR
jgi:hypothetical protein